MSQGQIIRSEQDRRIQTIQLEPYDDVTSIRDRLQFVETRRVLLIFPKRGAILRRKLDLILLQREAERRDLQLALLCNDPEVAEHADSINMSCFFSVEQARARAWRHPQSRVFVDRRREKPQQSIQHPYELMSVATRLKPARSPAQLRRGQIGRVIVATLTALILFGSLLAVIPSATVRLVPAADAISQPVRLTIDPEALSPNPREGILPAETARLLVQGDTVTLQSSGSRVATDAQARGRVIFINASDTAQIIPAGTVVSTTDNPPARFRSLTDVALAPEIGSTAEAEIFALGDTVGRVGNVPAEAVSRVEGALESFVTVRNPAPTFGGGFFEESFVTAEDHERLRRLAADAIIQAGQNELLSQLPAQDKFMVSESVRLVEVRPEWTIFSARVGDMAESVSLDMRGVIEALVVDERQARQLAFLSLSASLPRDRQLDSSSLTYRRSPIALGEDGRYTFQMIVQGRSPYAINAEQVAGQLRGRTLSQARRTLQNELLLDPRHPPEISVWPFNFGLMPLLPVRIQIQVVLEGD